MLKPYETRTRVLVYVYQKDRVWWKPRTWRRKLYEHRELVHEHEYRERLWKYHRERYDREYPNEESTS